MRKNCPSTWGGECTRTRPITWGEHACARPPGHPETCMCYCSARPATDGQEPLFSVPWRMTAAGLAAARRRRVRPEGETDTPPGLRGGRLRP
jgi:hypothetical protein